MKKGTIFIMLNFFHKHEWKTVYWMTQYYQNYSPHLNIYKQLVCPCGKLKKEKLIYTGSYTSYSLREEEIEKWKEKGVMLEEDFAFKYR